GEVRREQVAHDQDLHAATSRDRRIRRSYSATRFAPAVRGSGMTSTGVNATWSRTTPAAACEGQTMQSASSRLPTSQPGRLVYRPGSVTQTGFRSCLATSRAVAPDRVKTACR